MSDDAVTKSEFARMCNVHPSRVSQWIREGKIGADAMEGTGRSALIKSALAWEQIGRRTDPGQRTGNGLGTLLGPDALTRPIQAEKLRQIRFANEVAAEQRLLRRGTLGLTADFEAAMRQLARRMLEAFDSGLSEMAQAVAGRPSLSARDAVHLLRAAWREARGRLAAQSRVVADSIPGTKEVEIDDDDEGTQAIARAPAAGAISEEATP